MPNDDKTANLAALEQMILTSLESLFGTLLKKEEPILVDAVLARLHDVISGRAEDMAKSDRKHGWSPTLLGDPRNDAVGTIQERRIDNQLFVFAQPLPGVVSDAFRDRFSPSVVPLVMKEITDASTPEEIAGAVCDVIFGLASEAVRTVSGVPEP